MLQILNLKKNKKINKNQKRKTITELTKNNFFQNIDGEYELKSKYFHPKNKSPNLFLKKLLQRFEYYYKSEK